MAFSYMQRTVADFFDAIDGINQSLANCSVSVEERRSRVLKALDDFRKDVSDVSQTYLTSNKDRSSGVHNALVETISQLKTVLENWDESIRRSVGAQEFMHKNEKYLVAMVFGQVKTGKSSLGNFIGGQAFKNAAFDNEYKKRQHPEFIVEKSGRDGNIINDSNNENWFTEGVVDTTGAIQYFTLSGLRWVDSPGTGALEKEGDTLNMEELVNDYLDYTDYGIFLLNSSEPGLQADMAYIKKMANKGKDAVLVITKSDCKQKKRINEDFRVILMPKTKKNREEQEKFINEEVEKICDSEKSYLKEKFHVISVSTQLAKNAIKEEDDEKFKSSNLDKLMQLLGSKISESAVALKSEGPQRNLNAFINNVVNGYHSDLESEPQIIGLKEVETSLNKNLEYVGKFKNKIDEETGLLTKIICGEVRKKFADEMEVLAENVDKTGEVITGDKLTEIATKIVNAVQEEKITAKMQKIMGDYAWEAANNVQNLCLSGSLHKDYDSYTITHTEYETVERDADGLWESFKSKFFGSRYYRNRSYQVTDTHNVDLGTNVDGLLNECMDVINEGVMATVKGQLTYIQDSYFKPQEEYIDKIQGFLSTLENTLANLKYDV